MRPFIVSLFTLVLNTSISRADRLDELFATWQAAQRSAQSLVVEFTQETYDLVYQDRTKYQGSLRLLRTQKGEWMGSYEVTEVKAKSDDQRFSTGLLSNGAIYLLNPDKKTALRFDPAGGDVPLFLEKHWNPFVVLLNRQRAEERYKLAVVKHDDSHTYLDVTPKRIKPLKRGEWVVKTETFDQGRIVLANETSDQIPKGMPCQISYRDGFTEHNFKIKSWRLNAPDAPKPEEFTRPEDRAGWEVRKFGR